MYKSEKLYYRKAFFMAMIMGVILFLPFVLIDGGYFIYYGDYNAQQIPFIHFAIRQLKRQLYVELADGSRCKLHRFIFVLYARKPVLLAEYAVPGGVCKISYGTIAGA